MTTPDAYIERLDWTGIADQLDGEGYAMLPGMLDADLVRDLKRQAEIVGRGELFYFTDAARAALLRGGPERGVRRLTGRDGSLFAEFRSGASEQDLDEAYVELDHWAVFGSFEAGRLVCAASMYPWEGEQLADLGVLTLAPARGRGHARRVVRASCRHAFTRGFEPQYRCQLDNAPSIALARNAGLTLFGTWEVLSPGEPA